MQLSVETKQSREVVDITERVQDLVERDAKVVSVFVAHTTCAVTTADLDPGTDLDLLDAVWEMIPRRLAKNYFSGAGRPARAEFNCY
jgi:thiamine phosphate synthase YjbQ (UPF0047 family)